MKKSHVALTALAVSSLLWAVGCGGSSQTAANPSEGTTAAKTGGTLNIALSADPPKLDPAQSSALVDRMVFQSIFDKLVDLDSKGNIVPMLADKWEISDDQKTYTFHLHPGVKFQDGTDFNADAVKFNFDRDMAPDSVRRNELKAVKAITVVDPLTVKIELKEPFSPFLSVLTDRAGMMVSPDAVKKEGADFMNHPVGTGPFLFKDRVKGSTITLEKNPNYWQKGLPKLDKVVYKIITDSNVSLVNLKSGQVDMTDSSSFPTKEIQNMKNDPKISVINQPGLGYQGIWLNVSKPPFNKKEVRQAIDLLIDRDAIIKVNLNGAGTPAHSPFAPSSFAYGDSDKVPAVNVDQAKALLQKAGVSSLSFTFKIGTSSTQQQLGQMIQSMLKPAGIDVKLEQVEFGTLLDQMAKGNFEAGQLGWSGRPDADQNIYDFMVTKAPQNYAQYSSPDVDKLLADARLTSDQAKRKALYDSAMKILNEDMPYVYLFHQNMVMGISKSVHGFEYVPDGLVRTANLSKD